MSLTRFFPSVCQCIALINSEDESVSFESKCVTHTNLNDADAFSSIQSMCAAAQIIEDPIEDII
jgi:hypothetical protein